MTRGSRDLDLGATRPSWRGPGDECLNENSSLKRSQDVSRSC